MSNGVILTNVHRTRDVLNYSPNASLGDGMVYLTVYTRHRIPPCYLMVHTYEREKGSCDTRASTLRLRSTSVFLDSDICVIGGGVLVRRLLPKFVKIGCVDTRGPLTFSC